MPRKIKATAWEIPEATAADRALAAEGAARQAAGHKATRPQFQAMRRVARIEQERERHKVYASIPKKHWRLMSGRPDKILNDQAATYGLPVGGATISLHEVAAWLHEFLADNAMALRDAKAGRTAKGLDPLEIQIQELEKRYVPVDEFRNGMEPFCGAMRRAGDTLRKVFGPDAAQVLDDAMNEGLKEIGVAMGVEE
jgi:hypothetical protein